MHIGQRALQLFVPTLAHGTPWRKPFHAMRLMLLKPAQPWKRRATGLLRFLVA